jgi:hypothetical protein
MLIIFSIDSPETFATSFEYLENGDVEMTYHHHHLTH